MGHNTIISYEFGFDEKCGGELTVVVMRSFTKGRGEKCMTISDNIKNEKKNRLLNSTNKIIPIIS